MYFEKTKQLIKESKELHDEIISLEAENSKIESLSYYQSDYYLKSVLNNLFRSFEAETRYTV